jgi:hypothetical protein
MTIENITLTPRGGFHDESIGYVKRLSPQLLSLGEGKFPDDELYTRSDSLTRKQA